MADFYDYTDAKYTEVRDAAKNATDRAQDAARWMDTLKEKVLLDMGLVNTSNQIHLLSHSMPPFFDKIGDILHRRHLEQIYGATAEYTGNPQTLEAVFDEVLRMLQAIEDALVGCVMVCEKHNLRDLARDFESLEIENSKKFEKILYARKMYEVTDASATSYDNWILHLFDEIEDADDD